MRIFTAIVFFMFMVSVVPNGVATSIDAQDSSAILPDTNHQQITNSANSTVNEEGNETTSRPFFLNDTIVAAIITSIVTLIAAFIGFSIILRRRLIKVESEKEAAITKAHLEAEEQY